MTSNMRRTSELGVQFWNDSCDIRQLADAVGEGAVGATSNPVIVYTAVHDDPSLLLIVDRLSEEMPDASIDDITWCFVEEIGVKASTLLLPVYEESHGRQGFLSVQLSPLFYTDKDTMVKRAVAAASLAQNIAVKVPATKMGLEAMEEITARGVNVNSTVSFSVSQAIAAAEAMERGLKKRYSHRFDKDHMHPYITIMVGRLDDQLRRAQKAQGIDINPDLLNYAGIAVFKKAYAVFSALGYASTLLCAAYRTPLQWTELIGKNVIQTIPYTWWKRFNELDLMPTQSISTPVDEAIVNELYKKFDDFRAAYDVAGMGVNEFESFGASQHTLIGFQKGYDDLVALVRERIGGGSHER